MKLMHIHSPAASSSPRCSSATSRSSSTSASTGSTKRLTLAAACSSARAWPSSYQKAPKQCLNMHPRAQSRASTWPSRCSLASSSCKCALVTRLDRGRPQVDRYLDALPGIWWIRYTTARQCNVGLNKFIPVERGLRTFYAQRKRLLRSQSTEKLQRFFCFAPPPTQP